MPRYFHRFYARIFGYFWLPCPKCGEMFGGHEAQAGTRARPPIKGWCVCKKCGTHDDSLAFDS
jgi:hypothetical protein